MALKPPVEVPQGAIRLNTDSHKLEFYAQDQWWEMATDVPTLDGGARGLFTGGYAAPAYQNRVDVITIPSAGDATDFCDMHTVMYGAAGGGSRTRGMQGGGSTPGDGEDDMIQYVTIATQSDFLDFGNLTDGRRGNGGISNQTRFIIAAGYNAPSRCNIIDYVTIASLGDAKDFGDTSTEINNLGGAQSPTRGLLINGGNPSGVNLIEFITIASRGNSTDFGDTATLKAETFGCGNATRGVFGGGVQPSPEVKTTSIEYVTIATLGNSSKFGDLTTGRQHAMALSDSTRGVWAGGVPALTTMDYVSIATLGDAIDFGDLTIGRWSGNGGISNAHGGL